MSNKQFLLVVAHPDDETLFGATVFKLTRVLNAKVDVLLITNGEGGYRYSTLLKLTNGINTTDEKIAREHLPAIRKKEMLASCNVLGVRDVYMLDEKDHHYTTDITEMENNAVWNNDRVRDEVKRLLKKTKYDVIMLMLPEAKQHAHHKYSCILALEAIEQTYDFQSDDHPIVIAGTEETNEDYLFAQGYEELTRAVTKHDISNYQINANVSRFTSNGAFVFHFDRRNTFGHMDRLNYKTPVIWAMAEHKSQGTLIDEVYPQNYEIYFIFKKFLGERPANTIHVISNLFEELAAHTQA